MFFFDSIQSNCLHLFLGSRLNSHGFKYTHRERESICFICFTVRLLPLMPVLGNCFHGCCYLPVVLLLRVPILLLILFNFNRWLLLHFTLFIVNDTHTETFKRNQIILYAVAATAAAMAVAVSSSASHSDEWRIFLLVVCLLHTHAWIVNIGAAAKRVSAH